MAVLNASNFSSLLSELVKTENSYFIKDNKECFSFSDIAINALQNAKNIQNSIGQKKRFFISAKHTCFFLNAFLSVSASGNFAIPFNPLLSDEQLSELAGRFKADFIIRDVLDFPESLSTLKEPGEDSSEIILLTSGSTGDPKGVVLSQKAIFSNAVSVIRSMKLENPGNVGIILPLYHSFALVTQVITTFLTGGNIFLFPDFRLPGELFNFILNNNIETIAGVPSTFRLLLIGNTPCFENVKHITIAGGALEPLFGEKIKKAFPNAEIWVGYGLTEAGPRVTAIPYSDPKFSSGSVGKPIENVNISTNKGCVCVKSPSLMSCYLDDPEITSEKLNDGWLCSDDLGKIDEDGYLYISGRKDDIFISAGEKVSPVAIERVLNSFPGIDISAVYSETDDIMGNIPVALVKQKDNHVLRVKDLKSFCHKHLESHLIPRKFYKVYDLPLTPSGKLKRKELPQWQKEKI